MAQSAALKAAIPGYAAHPFFLAIFKATTSSLLPLVAHFVQPRRLA
jgi:hypothetical protein